MLKVSALRADDADPLPCAGDPVVPGSATSSRRPGGRPKDLVIRLTTLPARTPPSSSPDLVAGAGGDRPIPEMPGPGVAVMVTPLRSPAVSYCVAWPRDQAQISRSRSTRFLAPIFFIMIAATCAFTVLDRYVQVLGDLRVGEATSDSARRTLPHGGSRPERCRS